MHKLLTGAVIAIAALPGIASAAQTPCLTAGEFSSLASYGLPSIISGVAERCSATLPDTAWLKHNGADLSARYAEVKPHAWPGAKAAFMKLGGSGGDAAIVFKALPDTTLQLMVDGMIEGMIGKELPTERCVTVDRVVRLLAPLPPENTAELIAMAAGLGAASGRAKAGKFTMCPA